MVNSKSEATAGETPWKSEVLPSFKRMLTSLYEKQCKDSEIYVISGSMCRGCLGRGNVYFDEYSMDIECKVGPDRYPAFFTFVLAMISFILSIAGFVIDTFFLFAVIGAILLFISINIFFYLMLKARDMEMKTIIISSENLKEAGFEGPLVYLRFKHPPFPHLRKIKMIICAGFREKFYIEFDKLFGLLPENYKAALSVNPKE